MPLIERAIALAVVITGVVDRAATYLFRNVALLLVVVFAFLIVTGRLAGPAVLIVVFLGLLIVSSWAMTGGDSENVTTGIVRGGGGLRARVLLINVGPKRRSRPPRTGFGTMHGWAIFGAAAIATAWLGIGGLPAGAAWPVAVAGLITVVLAFGRFMAHRLFRPEPSSRSVSSWPAPPIGTMLAGRVSGTLIGPGATVRVGSSSELWRPVRRIALNRARVDYERCVDRPGSIAVMSTDGDLISTPREDGLGGTSVVVSGAPSRVAADVSASTHGWTIGTVATSGGRRPAIRFQGPKGPVVVGFADAKTRDDAIAAVHAAGQTPQSTQTAQSA